MTHEIHTSASLRRSRSHHVIRRDFRTLYPGVLVRRDAEIDFATRSRAAALLYPGSVLVGPSAACLLGASLDPDFLPEVVVRGQTHRRRGVVVRRYRVPSSAIVTKGGVRCTSFEQTVVDLGRFHPLEVSVPAIEAVFRARGAPATLWRDPGRVVGRTEVTWGSRKAREALELADPASESPWETKVRLALHRGGITGFETQVTVRELAYRLDLAHEEAMVAVEFDGGHHRDVRQQARDAERRNRLQRHGWIVITVTAAILMSRREEFLAQVRAAVASRGC